MSIITEKLEQLANDEGFDSTLELLEHYIFESVVPAICIRPGCDYYEELEPDTRKCKCTGCGSLTVYSIIELGIIEGLG